MSGPFSRAAWLLAAGWGSAGEASVFANTRERISYSGRGADALGRIQSIGDRRPLSLDLSARPSGMVRGWSPVGGDRILHFLCSLSRDPGFCVHRATGIFARHGVMTLLMAPAITAAAGACTGANML